MPRNDLLWQRLESARLTELHRLAEIVGVPASRQKVHAVLVEELSRDLRSAAAHSLLNCFRYPHDFPYKQILIDVADKMAPGWTPLAWTNYTLGDNHTELEIEETIWRFYEDKVNEKIKGMSAEAREELRQQIEKDLAASGYSSSLFAHIGGLGCGVAGAVGRRSAVALLGFSSVIFSLVYGSVLVWWVGSTAYRKTVPAVLHLIQIRKLREIEDALG